MEHLFFNWEKVKKSLNGAYVFLFLDFDGTLSPIVSTPDKAVIPLEVRTLLSDISLKKDFKVAIISGRSLADIKKRVGVEGIIYSGNHGLEVESPKINHKPQISLEYLQGLKKIKSELKERFKDIKGVFIEDKGISLAVHFRQAGKKETDLIKTIFREVAIIPSVVKKIKIRTGKKVIEAGPPVEWDKGKMVLWLISRQMFSLDGNKEVVAIYLGDDLTDEDAFKALEKDGITILVGAKRASLAKYYLNSPKEVYKFLSFIRDL
jgi:trehalose 6-phosphate phosphatase